MNDAEFDCELLRPFEYINAPDPRTALFSKKLVDYHKDVSTISLNDNVPREIALQFETAKNLYLYGWFVWRFFTVSEHHAFLCLELALRSRYKDSIPKKYFPRSKTPELKALLRYAMDSKDINNEEFETWRRITFRKARSRYKHNKLQEMADKNLNCIELNYDEVAICEEEKDWNYVQMLSEILPKQRNEYAHGSTSVNMFHGPLDTIRIVSEVINQIYSNKLQKE